MGDVMGQASAEGLASHRRRGYLVEEAQFDLPNRLRRQQQVATEACVQGGIHR